MEERRRKKGEEKVRGKSRKIKETSKNLRLREEIEIKKKTKTEPSSLFPSSLWKVLRKLSSHNDKGRSQYSTTDETPPIFSAY